MRAGACPHRVAGRLPRCGAVHLHHRAGVVARSPARVDRRPGSHLRIDRSAACARSLRGRLVATHVGDRRRDVRSPTGCCRHSRPRRVAVPGVPELDRLTAERTARRVVLINDVVHGDGVRAATHRRRALAVAAGARAPSCTCTTGDRHEGHCRREGKCADDRERSET